MAFCSIIVYQTIFKIWKTSSGILLAILIPPEYVSDSIINIYTTSYSDYLCCCATNSNTTTTMNGCVIFNKAICNICIAIINKYCTTFCCRILCVVYMKKYHHLYILCHNTKIEHHQNHQNIYFYEKSHY